MREIREGDRVTVTTRAFAYSLPAGTEATVVLVTQANWPPVPYYVVEAGGRRVGLYLDEFRVGT